MWRVIYIFFRCFLSKIQLCQVSLLKYVRDKILGRAGGPWWGLLVPSPIREQPRKGPSLRLSLTLSGSSFISSRWQMLSEMMFSRDSQNSLENGKPLCRSLFNKIEHLHQPAILLKKIILC